MSSTTNLLIALIAESQNLKEVTCNTALDQLDESQNSKGAQTMTDADFTLPLTALYDMFLPFSAALTGDRHIILPSGSAKLWIAQNLTTGGHNLIFKVGTGAATATLSDALAHLIYSDGLNTVYKVS